MATPRDGGAPVRIETGADTTAGITSASGKPLRPGDAFDVHVLWRVAGEDEWQGNPHAVSLAETTSDNLPDDWKMAPTAAEVGKRHVDVEWRQPPNTEAGDLECVV